MSGQRDTTAIRRLGPGMRLLLALAAVAVVALLIPWVVEDVNAKHSIPWRQGAIALLIAIPVLAILLIWTTKSRGPVLSRALLIGLLAGASLTIDAGAALVLFDYSVSSNLSVALRILPVIVLLAPMAAVGGCALGFLGGVVASMREARAIRLAAAAGSQVDGPSRRQRRWIARCVVGVLIASAAVALYFPISYELSRRRAILAIRAAGGRVSLDGQRRTAVAAELGPLGEVLSWLASPEGSWDSEGWFYSLESADDVTLAIAARDDQLDYVLALPEVQGLGLANTAMTDEGLKRLAAGLNLSTLSLRGTLISDEGLRHLSAASSLAYLDLSQMPITGEGLRHLAALPLLTDLMLSHSSVTDEGLRHLAGLPALRSLNLGHTAITDEGLRHVGNVPRITYLDLRGTKITDQGLEHLRPLVSVRWLRLEATPISGSGLKHLESIQGLTMLDLSRTRLTEPGLGHLGKLPQLSYLRLDGVRFEEAAFQELGQLSQLETLHLNGSNVTDAWLKHLSSPRNRLLHVVMYDTAVTEDGRRALQQSLSQAQVLAGQPGSRP